MVERSVGRRAPSSRRTRLAAVVACLAALIGGQLLTAAPASAAITSFSTSMSGTTGRAVYQWTAPAPAAQVQLKFVSTTSGTEWVFGLSSDVTTTASGTVNYTPRAMTNSACTMCIVSKISGPSDYLPNDMYTTSMSFVNADSSITTSTTSALVTSLFAMPAAVTPASNTTAGASLLTMTMRAPQSVKTDSISPYSAAPRFVISGTGACAGKVYTVILANPAINTLVTVTVDYASTPNVTSTVAIRAMSGDALIRGCSYDISVLYQSALALPPLPSNATNAPFVTSTVTNILIPNVPNAPSNVSAVSTGSTTATVSWTLGADGGLALSSQSVLVTPGNMVVTASSTATSAQITGLSDATAYTFTVTAVNAAGSSAASSAVQATTDHCLDSAAAGVNWSGCAKTSSALSGADLTGSNLSNANLTGSNLTNATLTNANLTDANLTGTTLAGVTSGGITGNSGTLLPSDWALSGGVLVTVPGSPAVVVASPGEEYAAVSWTAPSFTGYGTITGYTATAMPGSRSCTTTSDLTCIITGLSAGTTFTISVTASTVAGIGPAATASVTPRSASSGGGGGGSASANSATTTTSSTLQGSDAKGDAGQGSTVPLTRMPSLQVATGSVTFLAGSAWLNAAMRQAVDRQVAAFPARSTITITATVNPRGTAADKRMARKRAERVRDYLRSQGVRGPIALQVTADPSAKVSRRVMLTSTVTV